MNIVSKPRKSSFAPLAIASCPCSGVGLAARCLTCIVCKVLNLEGRTEGWLYKVVNVSVVDTSELRARRIGRNVIRGKENLNSFSTEDEGAKVGPRLCSSVDPVFF